MLPGHRRRFAPVSRCWMRLRRGPPIALLPSTMLVLSLGSFTRSCSSTQSLWLTMTLWGRVRRHSMVQHAEGVLPVRLGFATHERDQGGIGFRLVFRFGHCSIPGGARCRGADWPGRPRPAPGGPASATSALVVQVRQRPPLQLGVLRRPRHDGRVANRRPRPRAHAAPADDETKAGKQPDPASHCGRFIRRGAACAEGDPSRRPSAFAVEHSTAVQLRAFSSPSTWWRPLRWPRWRCQ
jgi:hypothetical protein